MNKRKPTKYAQILIDALRDRGIKSKAEYWDGHKTLDICIPSAKIYIEVDGKYHLTDPNQIIRDFLRDNYSKDDNYNTLRIPNSVIAENLDEIADAIKDAVVKIVIEKQKNEQ